MKQIPLTKGYVAVVSDRDYKKVMAAGPWHAQTKRNSIYASGRPIHGSRKLMLLHRFIIGIDDPAKGVDHRNHNGLDCRRRNLRVCTQRRNLANQRKRKGTHSSKYKGVHWCRALSKWQAQIKVNYKAIYLGCFANEIDAAKAYDKAARKHFGSFALTNF